MFGLDGSTPEYKEKRSLENQEMSFVSFFFFFQRLHIYTQVCAHSHYVNTVCVLCIWWVYGISIREGWHSAHPGSLLASSGIICFCLRMIGWGPEGACPNRWRCCWDADTAHWCQPNCQGAGNWEAWHQAQQAAWDWVTCLWPLECPILRTTWTLIGQLNACCRIIFLMWGHELEMYCIRVKKL